MDKFVKENKFWYSVNEYTDMDELDEVMRKYMESYPTAKIDTVEYDYGEWKSEYDKDGELIPEGGYYQEMYVYKIIIKFDKPEDEAEFILKESD